MRLILWALEGASVVQLQRRGWSKEKLKAGDKIAVRCHQLRDGSDGCLLGFITAADGVETNLRLMSSLCRRSGG